MDRSIIQVTSVRGECSRVVSQQQNQWQKHKERERGSAVKVIAERL